MIREMTPELEAQSQCVGNVWMPKTETHFPVFMGPQSKRFKPVGGKWTYQFNKLIATVEIMRAHKRRLGVCIDVGAHCGLWSMHLVTYFKKVEAFEPVGLHADLFEVNVVEQNYTLYRYALGTEEKRITIQTADDQTGSAHIMMEGREDDARSDGRWGLGEILTYPDLWMRTLDSFEFERVDLIKIDVEGWEHLVVAGGEATIRRCKPWFVVEQKGNERKGYGFARNAAADLLHDWGWRDVRVIAGDHIMRPPE